MVVFRFVNVAFTVSTGVNLVFDMSQTKFGPSTEESTVKRQRRGWTDPGQFYVLCVKCDSSFGDTAKRCGRDADSSYHTKLVKPKGVGGQRKFQVLNITCMLPEHLS